MKFVCSMIILLLFVSVTLTQTEQDSKTPPSTSIAQIFPPGQWTFSAHPFMGKGFDTRPVVVTSVKTEGLTSSVVAIRVRNISSKTVAALKVRWRLIEEKQPKNLLQEDETPHISVQPGLASENELTLTVPVMSFLDIHKPLVRQGRLDGDFRVDISVARILFSDGSVWTEAQTNVRTLQPQLPFFAKAGFSNPSQPLTINPIRVPAACAKQKCVPGGQPPSYSCGSSDFDEFCTNCGVSCCNTICGAVPACDCN
jgi:hypothetical protein